MGGPAHQVKLLSSRLPRDRYRTLLVAGHVGAGEAEVEVADDVELVRLDSLCPEIAPRSDSATLAALVRLMRCYRPDVVHTHTAKAGFVGRVAARAALGPRTTVVHTYHGHVLEGYFGAAKTGLYRALETTTGAMSDALVGVSQATVDDLVRLRVAPRRKFRVIPLGLDLDPLLALERDAGFRDEIGASADDLLCVWMGRLVPIKRVDLLLRAIAHAQDAGARSLLALVGGGPLEAELRRLAEELGIADRVRFLGYRSDVGRILAGADLAVLSSANEGTPVALIEAAAAGLPLVAPDVGGVRDVVADGTGTVTPPGDPAALGAAIARLAADPAGRAEMGERARRHVAQRYGIDRLVRDVDDLYRSLGVGG